ncbi:MAG: LytR C-terminal domain-containing protein [Patescibacteria group bacterium]
MPEEEEKKKRIKAVVEEEVAQEKKEEPVPQDVNVEPQVKPEETKEDEEEVPEEPRNKASLILIVILVALFVALASGAIFVYFNGVSINIPPRQTRTVDTGLEETPLPSALPTPESSEIDLGKLKMKVLNGSGRAGVAGTLKEIVEKAGFTVASTGNAQSFDFTNTLYQSKESVSREAIAKLKAALEKNYTVKLGDPLDESEDFDIVITVGKN